MTFTTAQSILSPPFNQNTLPLIVPGPQVVSTRPSAPRGRSSSGHEQPDLLVNDTSSQYQVTFDRPIQTSTFTPSQVLSIMGPNGSITGPQTFGPTAIDQSIPAATSAGPGTLDSTLTINSGGTLHDRRHHRHAQHRVQFGFRPHRGPGGARTGRRSRCSRAWAAPPARTSSTPSSTTRRRSSITAGTAPFTGTFKPEYSLNSATLTSLQGLTRRRHLAPQDHQHQDRASPARSISWSLNITPQLTVTPVAATETTINGVPFATAFTIGFPQQQLSGTYTIQLGPDIQDQFGNGMDPTSSAGLDVLRDLSQNGPTTTVNYTGCRPAQDDPRGDDRPVRPGRPGLGILEHRRAGQLHHRGGQDRGRKERHAGPAQHLLRQRRRPDGDPVPLRHAGRPPGPGDLFSGVGTGTNSANFNNTVLDDNAPTPIQEGARRSSPPMIPSSPWPPSSRPRQA